MAGVADLVVSNGEMRFARSLANEISQVPGVRSVRARLFENARLPEFENKAVLVMGIDIMAEIKDGSASKADIVIDPEAQWKYGTKLVMRPLTHETPVILGKELYDDLPKNMQTLKVQRNHLAQVHNVVRVPKGYIEAKGDSAALGGYVLILDLDSAMEVLDLSPGFHVFAASAVGLLGAPISQGPLLAASALFPGRALPADQVNCLDVLLEPGSDRQEVRKEIDKVLAHRAEVRTPEEQNQSLQSVMAGMQTGFSLCGVAALVVGLFLVYNSLSVSVAERRHEIGILLSLGATRDQVRRLFAGEAVVLGLTGSILGIPLGVGLAKLGLAPVQDILKDIFFTLDARQVEVPTSLVIQSLAIGIVTAMAAALVPAIQASQENPAEAVRRIAKAPTAFRLLFQVLMSLTLVFTGAVLILLRSSIPYRLGTYGGLMLVLVGALVASPFFAAFAARLAQPLVRRFLGIEWRLAADNLVRSPGRTGLVIGALAAGVSLVVQTAGTIRSNRLALRDWVQESITADLIVTSGSPVGAGGQSLPMDVRLAEDLKKLPHIETVLPTRFRKVPYRDTQIFIAATPADRVYEIERRRQSKGNDARLFKEIGERRNAIIASENFAALYGVRTGDTITLTSPAGELKLLVAGTVVDYSWNHGSLVMNRRDYLEHFNDDKVDVFDVYLGAGSDFLAAKDAILKKYGAQYGLHALTRQELQERIDDMIERLYGIAYGQQIVVMLVAALGVVTALLISVLQRRREMGLLRAIGASRAQVIFSVLAEACLMGFIGTVIGLVVGVLLEWYVINVVILEESGYLFPVLVPWIGTLVIAAAALATATLAGLGPAFYAVRQRIPEAIAYE
jgi:putative ABC transport system permease protein